MSEDFPVTFDLVEAAKRAAFKQHDGELRRDGKPYTSHLWAVAGTFRWYEIAEKAVAFLHDFFESGGTRETLEEAGIPQSIIHWALVLTHPDCVPYLEYIRGIMDECRKRKSDIAIRVKIADILHNLSDQPTKTKTKEYAEALSILIFEETGTNANF